MEPLGSQLTIKSVPDLASCHHSNIANTNTEHKQNRLKTLLNSFFNKTKKVNSYNGLQIKFSDCAFKTKKKKKIKNSALQKQTKKKSNKPP